MFDDWNTDNVLTLQVNQNTESTGGAPDDSKERINQVIDWIEVHPLPSVGLALLAGYVMFSRSRWF